MENCLLRIRHADGTTAAQSENVLYYPEEYLPGDAIILRVPRPGYYVICLDDAIGEEFVWMNGAAFTLEVPFGEGRVSYSPRAFVGTDHYLTARPAHAEEIAFPLRRDAFPQLGSAFLLGFCPRLFQRSFRDFPCSIASRHTLGWFFFYLFHGITPVIISSKEVSKSFKRLLNSAHKSPL